MRKREKKSPPNKFVLNTRDFLCYCFLNDTVIYIILGVMHSLGELSSPREHVHGVLEHL